MKIVNIDGEEFRCNFQERCACTNIKSHKKAGLHFLSRRYIFGTTPQGGGGGESN